MAAAVLADNSARKRYHSASSPRFNGHSRPSPIGRPQPVAQPPQIGGGPKQAAKPGGENGAHTAEELSDKYYANSIAWLADSARQDLLAYRIRDTIAVAFEKEAGRVRDTIAVALAGVGVEKSHNGCTTTLQSQNSESCEVAFTPSPGQPKARQLEVMLQQQAASLQAILRQLNDLTQTVAGLQEKAEIDQPLPLMPFSDPVVDGAAEQARFRASHAGVTCTGMLGDGTGLLSDGGNPEAAGDKCGLRHLMITITGCTDLPNSDTLGKSDPYCVCQLQNDTDDNSSGEIKTPVLQDTLEPVWNFTGALNYKAGDKLFFNIFDQDFLSDTVLGQVTLESSEIEQPGGFDGELDIKTTFTGCRPRLQVTVEVRQGPAPMMFGSSNGFGDGLDNDDRIEDALEDEDAQNQRAFLKKMKKAIIEKIPCPGLRRVTMRFTDRLDSLEEGKQSGPIAELEASKKFLCVSLLVVVLDQAVTVAASNDAAAREDGRPPAIFGIFETLFLIWFMIELAIKLYVHRLFFFIGNDYRMNFLDFFLVIYGSVEAVGLDLSFLRALRVFKMAKIVRMAKALRAVRDLRVMMDCLIGCWFTMLWGIVMIGFILYMFALVFVQAMSDYVHEHRNDLSEAEKDDIAQKFGSVQQGMLSLFMSLTGGFDWVEIYDLVAVTGPLASSACVFFVLLFFMSIWNIIGSIFVEKVLDMASPTPREFIEKQMIQHQVDSAEIRHFFLAHQSEMDERGTIKKQQIMETEGIYTFMSVRGINMEDEDDLNTLFQLAKDYDNHQGASMSSRTRRLLGDDEVSIEALTATCLKVKGPAMRFSVEALRDEIQRLIRRLPGDDRKKRP